jgi:uncharacterized protein YjbJ (UPF0337 family)
MLSRLSVARVCVALAALKSNFLGISPSPSLACKSIQKEGTESLLSRYYNRGRLPPFCLSIYRSLLVPNHTTIAAFIARDFVFMKSSTKDKIKGAFRETKGKVKEKAGKATGDPDLRDRGTVEKARGKVQRKITLEFLPGGI